MDITVTKKLKSPHLEIGRKKTVDITIKGYANFKRGVNIIIQDKQVTSSEGRFFETKKVSAQASKNLKRLARSN